MENTKKKFIAPPNNKAIFHTMSKLLADLLNDELPLEKADRAVNIARVMQKSLEIEIARARNEFVIGSEYCKIREIELTSPEA